MNVVYFVELDTTKFDSAGISMIAGFCIKFIQDKNICDRSTENMIEHASQSSSKNLFIKEQDLGGLKYPNLLFGGFVKTVLDTMVKCNSVLLLQKNVVKFWIENFSPYAPELLSCGCGEIVHSQLIVKLLFKQLAKIFIANYANMRTDLADQRSKLKKSKKVKKL
jgi:hypothetical protein